MDLYDAIKDRRSIRRFKPEPVEKEKLDRIFDAARLAPSWANTQVVRFYLVSDPDKRQQVVDCIVDGNPAKKGAYGAPHMIVVAAKKGVSGLKRGEAVTVKGDVWYMFDAGLACQNLSLAAHEQGLGTVHVGVVDTDAVHRILGLEENLEVIELMPIGYPDQEPNMPKRLEIEELVTLV